VTYVWIIEGEHNLNLELVRQGCFEPQTQTIGKGQKLEAPQADYDAFVQKALDAGKEAKEKKLGVWKASTE
jgi:endonuclease YncB( thermonuclease family)